MLQNWHAFFFNSFDAWGFVTIDKPPLGFWFQVVSAKIFGYNGLSLMLPQALAGVLSVAVLYRFVACAFGQVAGLLAALALALMPVNVAANRNNIDSTLVLFLLLGAWAVLRDAETGRLRLLLLCAALIGLGSNYPASFPTARCALVHEFRVVRPGLGVTEGQPRLLRAVVAGDARVVTVQAFGGQQTLPATSGTRYYLATATPSGTLAVGQHVAVATIRSDPSAATSVTVVPSAALYVSVRRSVLGGVGGAGGLAVRAMAAQAGSAALSRVAMADLVDRGRAATVAPASTAGPVVVEAMAVVAALVARAAPPWSARSAGWALARSRSRRRPARRAR